ncbi:MAG: T9SS type A sorting domain-containing protein [Bacteroidales bacterium]|nr:T9SS type A sorting domain-containing protein [Bacteroidales bacterium]
MKRNSIFLLVLMLLIVQQSYSQRVIHEELEDFDGSGSFTGTLWWSPNTIYSLPSPANPTGVSRSYRGTVPNNLGDTAFLQLGSYNFTNDDFVLFHFSHICKVSPSDRTEIWFKRSGESIWHTVDAKSYTGKAANYAFRGFNAASYPDWQANDSTARPTSLWWKDETFDMTADWGNAIVDIRFVIIRGNTPYSNASYGWLLENIRIEAAKFQLFVPVVEFISPLVKDTVFSTGAWTVNAKVATRTLARIAQPYLVYTATKNGQPIKTDSVLMSNIMGDSLWTGNIEPFEQGTKVVYSITGRDTVGNEATANSSYYIKVPPAGKTNHITIGTGTATTPSIPIAWTNPYSWTRQLYLGTEIDANASGELIRRLAWEYADTLVRNFPNQTCYFKVVDDVALSATAYVDPVTDGGTQVWQGAIDVTKPGWVEITLEQPFYLPAGKNLLIYWHNRSNGWFSHRNAWHYTETIFNSTVYYEGYTFSTGNGTLTTHRANVRFYVERSTGLKNSATLYAIDLPDTVITTANHPTPIVATIKNTGDSALHFINVSYTINGETPKDTVIHFSPALLWDYTAQVSLGEYTQRLNEYDTLKVWVSYPDNQYDSVTWDDTLTKIKYGTIDLQAQFVDYFTDTVHHTGSFYISANIRSRTGNTDLTNRAALYTEITHNGTTEYDTLSMVFNAANGLWETFIPQTRFASKITYQLFLTDFLGNTISLVDTFYTEIFSPLGYAGYRIAGTGTAADYLYPLSMYDMYSWTRQLYFGTEINPAGSETKITKLAWEYAATTPPFDIPNQTCYMRAVDDASITLAQWEDPDKVEATQVWKGSLSVTTPGWVEIVLDHPFILPPNKNLLIYWSSEHGDFYGQDKTWNNTLMPQNMAITAHGDVGWTPQNGQVELTPYRPNARFYIEINPLLDNSVALAAIDSPQSGKVSPNVTIPVKISVQNEGFNDLSFCTIEWTRNGIPQPNVFSGSVYTFPTPLPVKFKDTLTIGYYTTGLGQVDEITVRVSLPNGVNTTDDVQTTRAVACAGFVAGTYHVGKSSSTLFPNVSAAIFAMKQCGISGKVSLLVEDGTYTESIDLSELNKMLTSADTIEIMSLSGNADDVIFQANAFGVKIKDMENIYLKNISIHLSGEGYGVLLNDSCSNIEISDCIIYTDTTHTGTATTHAGIYKGSDGVADNVRIFNNRIIGGYAGIFLSAASTHKNTRCICNNNNVENAYHIGISIQHTETPSICYNTILSSAGNYMDTAQWWGMALDNCLLDKVSNNRINALGATHTPANRGISIVEANQGVDYSPVQFFNNEIMLQSNCPLSLSTANYTFGVQLHHSKVNLYHNSVYMSATTAGRVLHNVSSIYPVDIRNNMFIGSGALAWAVYSNGSAVTMDYNNYVYGNAMGAYKNTPVANLAAWQTATGQDAHATATLPPFTDINTSMEISSHFEQFLSPVLTAVSTDINGNTRASATCMGAYTTPLVNEHFTHFHFDRWNEDVIENQVVPVNIKVSNLSAVPVDSLVFDLLMNGVSQTYTHVFSSPLSPLADTVIVAGTFLADTVNNIEVWLRTVNGSATHPMKDSIFARSEIKPLAEFAQPPVDDTVHTLTFDVNVFIRSFTGAPTTVPQLNITTMINDASTLTSSIPMVYVNGIWQAKLPPQYYNSKVIYSLTVEDTLGNSCTITDSTRLKFDHAGIDTVIIGSGTAYSAKNPVSGAFNYSWSRNYYLDYEINPNRKGGTINSFSFYNSRVYNLNTDSVYFYFKAVSDSVASLGYIDPVADGATLVRGAVAVRVNNIAGWVTFVLDVPFYLPPNMNLLVYCNNFDGTWGGSFRWVYTVQPANRSVYADNDDAFPRTAEGTLSNQRPNFKVEMDAPSVYYAGHNLAVSSMIEPINTNDLCTPDYSPVKIVVTNWGEQEFNFSTNPVEVGVAIEDPTGNAYQYTSTVFTGTLAPEENEVIEIMSAMPIMYAGVYNIKAWATSAIDGYPYDDTLFTQFISGRVPLPTQEDFSNGIPLQFDSRAERGNNSWEAYNDPTATVQPNFGAGMIRFAGTAGAVALLTIRQVDLYHAVDPFVEFWYYHDTNTADDDFSFLEININVNGNEENLAIIYLHDPQGHHGWKRYYYSLSKYTTVRGCVLIQFKAMNNNTSPYSSKQYIDYIQLSSEPDVAVSEVIITPEPTACSRNNRTVAVVIATTRNQGVTFDNNSLLVNIDGLSHDIPLHGKSLPPYSSDTITILNMDMPLGKTSITACLHQPVDGIAANDTAKKIITINPKLEVVVRNISTFATPARATFENPQKITLKNTGNTELLNIGLILTVNTPAGTLPYHFSTRETYTQPLAVGDTVDITFNEAYTVPWADRYYVEVLAYVTCDSANVHTSDEVQEYVNMTDLFIVDITHPANGTIDRVGETVNVSLRIKNRDIGKIYNEGDVKAGILIKDTNGVELAAIDLEELPEIGGNAEIAYTFNGAYTVPSQNSYRIIAYLTGMDEYPENDTLDKLRFTDGVDLLQRDNLSFRMEQNVPNPAKESTTIHYSVPQDGEIVFHMYSVSGQRLYTKEENVSFGSHQIELNLSDYAAGVYFYSMEYNGQRLVKRMSIKR